MVESNYATNSDGTALSSSNGKTSCRTSISGTTSQEDPPPTSPDTAVNEESHSAGDDERCNGLQSAGASGEDLKDSNLRNTRDKTKPRRRTRSMTRSSHHTTVTPSVRVKSRSRSRSRTPVKYRSNSVEELRREKSEKIDSISQPRRARSKSRVRENDRIPRSGDLRPNREEVGCATQADPPVQPAADSKKQRSRSKSATRDVARRSRSRPRPSTARKARQESREWVGDKALIRGKRSEQRNHPRERSKSRVRRVHRKNVKGADPESASHETSEHGHETSFKGNDSMEPEAADQSEEQTKSDRPYDSPLKTSESANVLSEGLKEHFQDDIKRVESPMKSAPDPIGILCCNESVYFSKEDLPVLGAEGEPLAKNRHSGHRRRTKVNGPAATKSLSDKKGTRGSTVQSAQAKSNRKPLQHSTPSPNMIRPTKPPETPKRKQRSASSLTITPSRRERRKTLSTTKIGNLPMVAQSKEVHARECDEMTFQRNAGSHKRRDSGGKIDPRNFRTRPKKENGTPNKLISSPSQKNQEQLTEGSHSEVTSDGNVLTMEDTDDLVIQSDDAGGSRREKAMIGVECTEASNQVHQPVSSLTLPIATSETGQGALDDNNNPFSALLDCDASFAETLASNKMSVTEIFGHLNNSSSTVATRDFLATLGPYLPQDHPLAQFLKGHESETATNKTKLSQTEHSPSTPGLLGALLESSPPPISVAAPSLNSSSLHRNRTLDSLLNSGPKFSTLPEPSMCSPVKCAGKNLGALLDAKSSKLASASEDSPQQSPEEKARRSTGNLDELFPSSFPSSLNALLDAKPRGFSSSLPEPSICPSPGDQPFQRISRVAQAPSNVLPSVIPEDEYLSPSKPISRRTTANRLVEPRSDSRDLFQKNKYFFDYSGEDSPQKKQEGISEFGSFGVFPGTEALPQVSRHSTKDLGELLPSSEHVKVHRASSGGSASSVEFPGNPGYLQLDLQALGSESSHEAPKSNERMGSSRHISIRKSIASFRKKPGHESLLGDCE